MADKVWDDYERLTAADLNASFAEVRQTITDVTTFAVNNGGTAVVGSKSAKRAVRGRQVTFLVTFTVTTTGSNTGSSLTITGMGLPQAEGSPISFLATKAGAAGVAVVRASNSGGELTFGNISVNAFAVGSANGTALVAGDTWKISGSYLSV